jgi:hypothetical protein
MIGHLESQAFALLGLGAFMTVFAAIRLVRLNEEMPAYRAGRLLGLDERQRTRQAWSSEKRLLRGLTDWTNERDMARLTRMARRAPESWWSRVCRWQVGMVAGWSLWVWIASVLVFAFATTWLMSIWEPNPASAFLGMASFVVFVPPVGATVSGVFQFKSGSTLLLPVERRSYIRQVGVALALSHFQFWAGLMAVLLVWWLLIASPPSPFVLLANLLAFSAAFQVVLFGAVAWTARYRSKASLIFVLSVLFVASMGAQMGLVSLSPSFPAQTLRVAMAIACINVLVGLLITLDAYRRWLKADFD